jgi:hypothetical protein
MFEPRIARTEQGRFRLQLPDNERDVLRALPDQLRSLLTERDALVHRLFPPAYTDDVARSEEYSRLTEEDLVAGRLSKLETFERTLDAEEVGEEELVAWLGALNDLRLVIGTRLDVTEDMDPLPDRHPDAGLYALYSYLGWLQEQLVEALVL